MSDLIVEHDKNKFFYNVCGLKRYHRNILSYCIFSVSTFTVVGLTMLKIQHPILILGSVAMNGLAHFLKTSSKADLLEHQLEEKESTIRRLSLTNSSGSIEPAVINNFNKAKLHINLPKSEDSYNSGFTDIPTAPKNTKDKCEFPE